MPETGWNNLIDFNTHKKALEFTSYFILRNSGTQEDVSDILQEAIMIFLQKAQREEISHEARPETLLYHIARKLWLDALRKRKMRPPSVPIREDIEDNHRSELELQNFNDTIIAIMDRQIQQMKELCQEIIRGRMNGESYESLAKRLDIKDIRNIWIHYHRCKEKLKQLMNEDDQVKELFENG